MKAVFIGSNSEIADMAWLSIRLRWPDAAPLVATTALAGLELVEQESPDVVLRHPSFSDMSLAEAVQELRRFSNVPLLVLSHQGSETEIVTALEMGADDYVRLPCDMTEMMARVWALLRRVGAIARQEEERPLRSGDLLVNPITYEVFLGDRRVVLTSTEFRVLHLLLKNRGIVVSHETLGRTLWGEEVDSSGLVKKYVQRVRRKLGDTVLKPRWIVSIHGTGYRFVGPASDSRETAGQVLVSAN